jgi:polyprenyldihydroxybenzoate methyltransferase/3-demethylubiquinol 3-O-methyltransferase
MEYVTRTLATAASRISALQARGAPLFVHRNLRWLSVDRSQYEGENQPGESSTESLGCEVASQASSSSINPSEVAKFAKLSSSWWNLDGPFKPLHAMNKSRCEFIKQAVDRYIMEKENLNKMEEGDCMVRAARNNGEGQSRVIRILDVGCGGGILSESLATLYPQNTEITLEVLGIDVNQKGIDEAMRHKETALPLGARPCLDYKVVALEDLLTGNYVQAQESNNDAESKRINYNGYFDITIASEVIEHVDAPEEFCRNLMRATSAGGRVIISTLNRTIKSYGLAVLGAEDILGLVPRGTHDWSKFLTPEELVLMMTEGGSKERCAQLDTLTGMVLNPLSGMWRLDADHIDVNYIASFQLQGASAG